MKKIGIFLGFGPEQSIKEHGIGRLLFFLLSGMLEDKNVEVTIAFPKWFKVQLEEFFHDQNIDINKVKLISTAGLPYVLRIRNLFLRYVKPPKKARYKFLKRYFEALQAGAYKLVARWLGASSLLVFLLLGAFVLPLLIVALPFIIIHQMYQAFAITLSKIDKRHRDKIKNKLVTRYTRFFTRSLKEFKKYPWAYKIYDELRRLELTRLVKNINKFSDIKVWFIPSMIWPEIELIKTKKILAVPDIVFIDFPTRFSNRNWPDHYKKIAKTLSIADHYICYSDYVKRAHLVDSHLIDPNNVSVIKHAPVNLSTCLVKKEVDERQQLTRYEALEILQDLSATKGGIYLRGFDFTDTRFIFYASQIRPHKNFISLVKAFEILLRERYTNIKLIITGQIADDPEVATYIYKKRLERDILAFPEISSKALAALNHLALCSVNPTLFEGGFPFTFSEAYSVGTPSVMSRIPVVIEEIDAGELVQRMLFDPYNLNDMANKIEWAVNNRETLYSMQAPLYKKLQCRTWETVADEYINLFQSVANDTLKTANTPHQEIIELEPIY